MGNLTFLTRCAKRTHHNLLKLRSNAYLISGLFYSFISIPAHAENNKNVHDINSTNYSFNTALIRGFSDEHIDFNELIQQSGPTKGTYTVDFSVNNNYQKTLDIPFLYRDPANHQLQACVPVSLLQSSGIKEEFLQNVGQQSCVFVADIIKGAKEEFNFNQLALNLFVPGTAMVKHHLNDAPSSVWDYGESLFFTNYITNYYYSRYRNNEHNEGYSSSYLSLNSGLNLGRWRLRNNSNYNKSSNQKGKLSSLSTFVQRAIPALRSEFTIGQTFTSGRLFDSVAFRGIKLESDHRMLPQRKQGYAPEIHGFAETNARVKVMQGNNLLYEATVAPGAFVINDLVPITYGSDLNVEVTESDGRTNHFTVAYSAVSQSLRPGLHRFSVTLGQTDNRDSQHANFAELTYEQGISNALTFNTGIQLASNYYRAATLGAVLSTRFGALGFNATHTNAHSDEAKKRGKGKGWLIKGDYSQHFDVTKTNVTLAAYRYASKGYISLNDSLDPKHNYPDGLSRGKNNHQRHRFEINVNQRIFKWGSIYANASMQRYYNNNKYDKQYQLGYANSYGKMGYKLSLLHQETINNNSNNVWSLGFSIPLNFTSRQVTVSNYFNHSRSGTSNVQTKANGVLGKNNNINYNVTLSQDFKQKTNSAGFSINKATSIGTFGAALMHQTHAKQISASAQGAAVIHKDGVILGPHIGDTFAIVEAKDAKGASLNGVQSVNINNAGFALVPSMSAYSFNQINLNPTNMNHHVELKNTQKFIVPTSGAGVKVKFETSKGYLILVSSKRQNDKSLPLGATVFDASGQNIGLVGQGSRAYARVKNKTDSLTVRWGVSDSQQCTIHYHIDDKQLTDSIILLTAPCH